VLTILTLQHNVLISDDGKPLLADFGRSKFIDHPAFTTVFSGSSRYLAPELVNNGGDVDDTDTAYEELEQQSNTMPNLTRETDVFAFSMATLEVSDAHLPEFSRRYEFSNKCSMQPI